MGELQGSSYLLRAVSITVEKGGEKFQFFGEIILVTESGQSIQIRIKEHNRHIRPVQTDKSAVAEHGINWDHIIKL